MTQPTGPDFAGRSPWTRPGFIAAAVIAALVVLAGLLVVLVPDDDDGDRSAPPPDSATAAPPATAATTGPASDPAAAAIPTAAPTDVEWKLFGQTAVPHSASAGPRTVNAGVASGYAHTPVGALIAAAQIAARAGISAGRAVYEPTIQQQFVPSPDRDKLLATLIAANQAAAEPGDLSQITGFQYISYTPDAAVVGLVFRAPAGRSAPYHVVTTSMSWRDGDWKMNAPPGGVWTSVNRVANDLNGVVTWGAR